MNAITDSIGTLKGMGTRNFVKQTLQLGMIVSSALVIWHILMLVTNSQSPIVVVLSGSMEPGFYRGDILFLNMGTSPIDNGEIVVYTQKKDAIPIVHRTMQVYQKLDDSSRADILTKGDNNDGDDRSLYSRGLLYLQYEHLMGRVQGYLPYIGYITIMMNDHPPIKFALLAGLGLMVILGQE